MTEMIYLRNLYLRVSNICDREITFWEGLLPPSALPLDAPLTLRSGVKTLTVGVNDSGLQGLTASNCDRWRVDHLICGRSFTIHRHSSPLSGTVETEATGGDKSRATENEFCRVLCCTVIQLKMNHKIMVLKHPRTVTQALNNSDISSSYWIVMTAILRTAFPKNELHPYCFHSN